MRGDPRTFLGGDPIELDSAFISTSIEVVMAGRFRRGKGLGALFVLDGPSGTRAAWIAGIGTAEFRAQGEVLLARRTRIVVTGIAVVDGVIRVFGRVIP